MPAESLVAGTTCSASFQADHPLQSYLRGLSIFFSRALRDKPSADWNRNCSILILGHPFTFSALTLLGDRKGIRPVKNSVVGCWHGCLSGARCRLAYGPANAYCHSSSLASVKSRLVLPFRYWLAYVVPEKGPLNSVILGHFAVVMCN